VEELEDFDESNIKDVRLFISYSKYTEKSNSLIYIKRKTAKTKDLPLFNSKTTAMHVLLLTE